MYRRILISLSSSIGVVGRVLCLSWGGLGFLIVGLVWGTGASGISNG